MNTDSKNSSHEAARSAPIPVVILCGPTAVGKTSLIGSLGEGRYEIVSADSRQVYRYLDIGTAKPSRETLEQVRHHLIDVCDPSEQYTSGRFVRDADRAVRRITDRGRFAVVSGGTGYYIRHFLFGLPEGPGSFPEIRAELKREMDLHGVDAMYRMLAEIDPVTANRISPKDRYRVERALEVYRGTGRRLSDFRVPAEPRTCYRTLTLMIDRPRSELYERIDRRVELMFDEGLQYELERVLQMGFGEDAPGLSSIGYAELLSMRRSGCRTLSQIRETIKRNTRRYAKRQITFFKRLPGLVRLEADDADTAIELIRRHLHAASAEPPVQPGYSSSSSTSSGSR